MMKWCLLATLILSCQLQAAVFSAEGCDGDGYYAGAIGGLNTRVRNYGGSSILRCENNSTTDKTIPTLGWTSITSQGNGTVLACTLRIFTTGVTAGGNVNAYLQLKPYIEGTADNLAQNGSSSWDEWYTQSDAAQDTLFTTKGAIAPTAWGDTGSTWNRNDATGDDRTGTSMGVQNVTTGAEYKFVIDAAWLNAFMTGTIPQFTVLLIPDAGVIAYFYERLDGDYGGVRSAILNIWWDDTVAEVSKGTGRFGRAQDGRYLNDR